MNATRHRTKQTTALCSAQMESKKQYLVLVSKLRVTVRELSSLYVFRVSEVAPVFNQSC